MAYFKTLTPAPVLHATRTLTTQLYEYHPAQQSHQSRMHKVAAAPEPVYLRARAHRPKRCESILTTIEGVPSSPPPPSPTSILTPPPPAAATASSLSFCEGEGELGSGGAARVCETASAHNAERRRGYTCHRPLITGDGASSGAPNHRKGGHHREPGANAAPRSGATHQHASAVPAHTLATAHARQSPCLRPDPSPSGGSPGAPPPPPSASGCSASGRSRGS